MLLGGYVVEIKVTTEKLKIIGKVKGRTLRLREKLVAYGIYKGRLGVETPSGVYILADCVDFLEVQINGKVMILDFRPFSWICKH